MKFGQYEIAAPVVDDPRYVQYLVRFDNSYGASIISFGLHGREVGSHWEVAVVRWISDTDWCMEFGTEITDDVIPNLSDIEVGRILDLIKALPEIIDGEIVERLKELES